MKSIVVEVDEEFLKTLEEIKQPYVDKPMLLRNLLLYGLTQYRIESAIQKYLE